MMMLKPGDNPTWRQMKVGDLVLIFWKDAYVGEGKKDFAPAAHVGFIHKKTRDSLYTSCIACGSDSKQHDQVDVTPRKMIERVVLLNTGVDMGSWLRSIFMLNKLPEWYAEAMGFNDKPE